jgi:hypothetical protein
MVTKVYFVFSNNSFKFGRKGRHWSFEAFLFERHWSAALPIYDRMLPVIWGPEGVIKLDFDKFEQADAGHVALKLFPCAFYPIRDACATFSCIGGISSQMDEVFQHIGAGIRFDPVVNREARNFLHQVLSLPLGLLSIGLI